MTAVTYCVESFFERACVNPTSRNTSSYYSHNLIIRIAMIFAMVRIYDKSEVIKIGTKKKVVITIKTWRCVVDIGIPAILHQLDDEEG